MNVVGWFEIPVNDLNRATKFYEGAFGVKMKPMESPPYKMSMFPFQDHDEGATGALIQGEYYKPSHSGTVVYFSVKSIEDTMKKILAQGGKTILEKKSIGEYGFIAMFEDSEGNRVALHSMK
ncbi:VOC family protein [Bdellovibrio sp. 22V]|uniref:VOC family protein n=1 Tax=Bdellovibrio TaxID=958 RepID=UPI002543C27C|nr:VOC family protein [Bdellovibrio sp. 22V]WII73862.1 VOC family protein [Bdellovibrio sp. 22V]